MSPSEVAAPRLGSTADAWFSEFITRLQGDSRRRRRLARERVVVPAAVEVARMYEQKTEMLRRMVVVERERWLAESEKTA